MPKLVMSFMQNVVRKIKLNDKKAVYKVRSSDASRSDCAFGRYIIIIYPTAIFGVGDKTHVSDSVQT